MDYFNNVTEIIDVPKYDPPDKAYVDINDPILRAIGKYKSHPSICRIKLLSKNKAEFKFKHFFSWKVKNAINSLKNKTSIAEIPVQVLKRYVDICLPPLTDLINNIVNDGHWPIELGPANVTPAHKKMSATNQKNYRPISVLPPVSKIFERLLCIELSLFMKDKFSPSLCGFKKNYNTQHALIRLIERFKHFLDNSGVIAVVLTDLFKAYDCIPHDLFIAKLHAYGIGMQSLKLLYSYLTNRKQRVKINNSFSDWFEIMVGVPQGSVLGPILFSIFINDFLLCIDV